MSLSESNHPERERSNPVTSIERQLPKIDVVSSTLLEAPYSRLLHDLFAGRIEAAFVESGIADPDLTSHVTKVVTRFITTEDLGRFENEDGTNKYNWSGRENILDALMARLVELEVRERDLEYFGQPLRPCFEDLGDRCLAAVSLYSPLFGEADSAGQYLTFRQNGSWAYAKAAVLAHREQPERFELLGKLAEDFNLVSYALRGAVEDWIGCTPKLS